MQGLYYLLALAWFAAIVVWAANNDRLKRGEPTGGLLKMERDTPPASKVMTNARARVARNERRPED